MHRRFFSRGDGYIGAPKCCGSRKRRCSSFRRLRIEALEARIALAGDVVISELLASNTLGISDVDGDSSDWFELHNRDTTSVDLIGWYVSDQSDNLKKWQIPVSTVLAPDARIVVFASNKDFVASSGELHTNFKLSKGGEFLGLSGNLGSLVHSYSPEYPSQTTDVSYGLDQSTPTVEDFAFFSTPTPGASNGLPVGGVLGPPVFSTGSQTFPDQINLVLTADAPEEIIRYTTDGTVPDENSTVYTGPLTITQSAQIRARVFRDGFAPSSTVSESYIKLRADMQAVSSDLPIVVIENFEGTVPFDKTFRNAFMSVFEPGPTGRTDVNGPAELNTRMAMHRRGGSTYLQPKMNLRIETRDEFDEDKVVEILGFPAESDFILYAPYTYDRAMIRNTFIFELSNQIGRYATRTRFVELYVNFGDDELGENDYLGVYILEENIKADANRVNIPRLSPNENSLPNLSGGYIFKIDRSDGPQSEFVTPRNTYVFVEPAPDDISTDQKTYLADYVTDLEGALYGNDFTDPVAGYKAFLNVNPTIDHHMLRYLTGIVDHFQLSTHFVKHRNGKAEYGPIWDHDRAMGSDGGGDSLEPTGYYVFLSTHWFNRLFQDPDFAHAWSDRWAELRKTFFSTENIHAIIDAQAAEIAESQVRNFERWPAVAPNGGALAEPGLDGWEAEVSHVKQWLSQRLQWTDSQLVAPASFALYETLPAGYSLTLAAPAGSIYVTVDGTDPLASGGQPTSQAVLYQGEPLVVDCVTSITARAMDPDTQLPWTWSPLTSARYEQSQPCTESGSVQAIQPRLPGDYNADGSVDAADFTTWQNTLGQVVPRYSGADGNGSRVVDRADYGIWAGAFGTSVKRTLGSTATLPERPAVLREAASRAFEPPTARSAVATAGDLVGQIGSVSESSTGLLNALLLQRDEAVGVMDAVSVDFLVREDAPGADRSSDSRVGLDATLVDEVFAVLEFAARE